MASCCQGSPVDLFRTPPHRSTTFSPQWYTQQAPPSSCRLVKFSAKASRTASKPRVTSPSIRVPERDGLVRSGRAGFLTDDAGADMTHLLGERNEASGG